MQFVSKAAGATLIAESYIIFWSKMLSGTRARGNRSKRAEIYENEETESMLLDAEAIKVSLENRPKILTEEEFMWNTSNPSHEESKMDATPDFGEERTNEQGNRAKQSAASLCRKAENSTVFSFLHKEPCFNPDVTFTTICPFSEREGNTVNVIFDKMLGKPNCNAREVKNRSRESVSQMASKAWELCNEQCKFKAQFSESLKKCDLCNIPKASKVGLSSSKDDFLFSESSTAAGVKDGLELRPKSKKRYRKVCNQPEKKGDLFTDFRLLNEEPLSGKKLLTEFSWGQSAGRVLQSDRCNLRDKQQQESSPSDLFSGKDILKDKIPNQILPQEDLGKLMEDSSDLVEELNNSGENEFTDNQGERSFVCLVDQLTDARVAQKFAANFSGRRRQAVCEELEKEWIWHDKSLYEHRRDLNVIKALGNFFL